MRPELCIELVVVGTVATQAAAPPIWWQADLPVLNANDAPGSLHNVSSQWLVAKATGNYVEKGLCDDCLLQRSQPTGLVWESYVYCKFSGVPPFETSTAVVVCCSPSAAELPPPLKT